MVRIGYHYLITRDGRVEAGRKEAENSPHDSPEYSRQAISVCLVGGVNAKGQPEDNYTPAQKAALAKLIQGRQVKVMTDSLSEDVVLNWKG